MDKKGQALLMASAALAATFGMLAYRLITGEGCLILLDGTICMGFIFGLILLDVYRLQPSASHSWRSLMVQYLTQRILYGSIGFICGWRFNRLQAMCKFQQEQLLLDILKTNSNTRVGSHFNISKIEDVREFLQTVPLTTYSDYSEFFQDIAEKGTPDVLFPGHADYIAMTSGTSSGKSKMFPKNKTILRRKPGLWWLYLQRKMLNVKGNHFLRKVLGVRVYPKFTLSKSGIQQGPVSGVSADADLPFYVTPFRGGDISSEPEAIYINLLFAIGEPEIGNMFFSTSALALTFLKTLETKWQQLCNDLERGCVSETLAISDKWRTVFNIHLQGGSPARAREVRAEFEKGFKGIVPRVWPTCPALFCIATGPFSIQAKIVKDLYLGDVPVISPFHAGSESSYGLNLDLENPETTYVALTPVNFFEFIPEENVAEARPNTKLAHQVEVGKVYEMVVTTWEGLYRYRTEDLVRVEGFHGQVPRYSFFQRSGDTLTAYSEKVPETLLSAALAQAADTWSSKPIENYTSVENVHVDSITGETTQSYHYIVFLELLDGNAKLTEQECSLVDEKLIHLHERYATFRGEGKLGPVQIHLVKPGTFLKIRDAVLASNPHASFMQYKLPRIIRRRDLLAVLIENTMAQNGNHTS